MRRLALLGCTLLGACAVIRRPPATLASIQASAAPARAEARATVDTVVERLARRAVRRGDRTLDLLFLSGGGQHGAYGVGFLRGWRERADAPMPRFDLVTGVSTGALQAPFALLGTEAALDTLAMLYRNAADEIAPTVDWLFWLRRTGGVVKTARYERALARMLDARLRDQLRAEFGAGRQLAVATTDFDLGVGRTWDMARELDSTAAGRARARTLLVASTAIPGIFPPTVIDGHVHADGGIVANVLSPLDLDDYRALARRIAAAAPAAGAQPVTVRVWVVLNLWTHAAPAVVKPSSRGAVAKRGNLLLFWSQQPQLVQRLTELARAVSADVPGLRMEVRYTAVPAELSTAPGAAKLFDRAWMRRLEQLGYDRAQSASPWDEVPSPFERPATRSAAAAEPAGAAAASRAATGRDVGVHRAVPPEPPTS
jgi:hypothetical protein